MKLGEIVVHIDNYNFTKFHQNLIKNKKVFLIAHFSVQNFKVSVESWKLYIVRRFTYQAGLLATFSEGVHVFVYFMYYLLNEVFTFSVVGPFFSCIVILLWSTEVKSLSQRKGDFNAWRVLNIDKRTLCLSFWDSRLIILLYSRCVRVWSLNWSYLSLFRKKNRLGLWNMSSR